MSAAHPSAWEPSPAGSVFHTPPATRLRCATCCHVGIRENVRIIVTWKGLRNAAIQGCEFCSVLVDGLRHFDRDTLNDKQRKVGGESFIGQMDTGSSESQEQPTVKREGAPEPLFDANEMFAITHHADGPVYVTPADVASDYWWQLEYFRLDDDARQPLDPLFGTATLISESPDLAFAAALIAAWTKSCDQHAACTVTSDYLPTRLLDIAREPLHLINGSQLCKPSVYVTMSHCWGLESGASPPVTTLANLAARQAGVRLDELPPLFREAVSLARQLQYSYIWIDSLCILQDDEDDWARESIAMAQVYSCADLNIAAVGAKNCMQSLLTQRWRFHMGTTQTVRQSSSLCFKITQNRSSVADIYVRQENNDSHNDYSYPFDPDRLLEIPLLERAWVFQELLLSRRNVYFTSSELMWHCRESFTCECTGLSKERDIIRPTRHIEGSRTKHLLWSLLNRNDDMFTRQSKAQLMQLWHDLVAQYAALSLTKEADRTFALTGLARLIHQLFHDDYLAGLWRSDLPIGLLWSSVQGGVGGHAFRQLELPSWSWMSRLQGARCRANYEAVDFGRLQVYKAARVLPNGTFCVTTEADGFGKVLSGQIEIEAEAFDSVICERKESIRSSEWYYTLRGRQSSDPETSFFFPDSPRADRLELGQVVQCLVLAQGVRQTTCKHMTGILVLRPTEDRPGFFRRIGMVMDETKVPFISKSLREATSRRFKIL